MSKYTPIDYIRNFVFGSCKNAFMMLLDEGMSLQDAQKVVADVQEAVTRGLQMAASEAIIAMGVPQQMQPPPEQPPQSDDQDNPFRNQQ